MHVEYDHQHLSTDGSAYRTNWGRFTWVILLAASGLYPWSGARSAEIPAASDSSTLAEESSIASAGDAAPISTLAVTGAAGKTYHTEFDTSENPISEGGVWTNGEANAIDWTNVVTANGNACGTHGGVDYDDSFAHLSGFSPDHTIEGTVYRSGSFGTNQEIELLLRWYSAAHVARGYEILWPAAGSTGQVVRWNGRLGDFTVIGSVYFGRESRNGDLVSAQIAGDTITAYLNGAQLQTSPSPLRDSTWQDGNPGIGFFTRDPSQNSNYCFTSITASDADGGISPTQPMPPTDVRAE